MTHDKKILDGMGAFSPVSLENAEASAQLEMTLEKVVLQEGKEFLSAFLEENHARLQRDRAASPALEKSTPNTWIFGLIHTTPRV